VNRCALSTLFILVFAAGTAHGNNGSAVPLRFDATLSGSDEVPAPVNTLMFGRSDFLFNPEETVMRFILTFANAANVTGAQLHCGPQGTAGPAVVSLLRPIEGGWNGSVDIKAMLTDANIIQGVDCFSTTGRNIGTLADLAATMRDGNVYVNITSATFPEGEIRGQVQATLNDLALLLPPGTFPIPSSAAIDSPARVPLQIGGESGAFIRNVTPSPETVISLPTTFNPPLRDTTTSPSSVFNPPLRDTTTFPSSVFNPPLETSPSFNPGFGTSFGAAGSQAGPFPTSPVMEDSVFRVSGSVIR